MIIPFSKMHGLGNDFVIIDATDKPLQLTPAQIRYIADRQRGIGCDQLLLLQAATNKKADFIYRIFNADGSEAGQCGNGARCIAQFIRRNGLSSKNTLTLQTQQNEIIAELLEDNLVCVNMGRPIFEPARIPFRADEAALQYTLHVGEQSWLIAALSMGNPHAILNTPIVETAPVAVLGPAIAQHRHFPEGVNVSFMQILNPQHIKLRVYERGTGETLACGSGACAASVAGRRLGLLENEVKVSLPGGDLNIHWQGEGHPVWMTGNATHVFEGKLEIS